MTEGDRGEPMNGIELARETVRGIVVAATLAASALGFTGHVGAAQPEGAMESEVSAQQNPVDLGGDGSQGKGWWQQRQERRRARAEAYREQLRSRQPEPSQNAAGRAATFLSATELSDLSVSFRLDRRLTSGLYMGDRWVSPATYSGIQEDAFTVDVRAEARERSGQPGNINPVWTATDPKMVTLSPGRGKEATITVHRAGESRVRVTVPAEPEDLSVSVELAIRASYQGTALQVEITRGAVTNIARAEQTGPAVRNGWKFVVDDGSRQPEPRRPVVRNGWAFVDGDEPAQSKESSGVPATEAR
jgi:hypothetical protein